MRGAFKDFEVFGDIEAPWCPEMVVIPSGSFFMGSPPGEEGRYGNEGPQHRVTIGNRFALGKYAVRFSEYDHFCEVTKRAKPEDRGEGRGQRPVINVSWLDAVALL
ncbi:MAG: SUMF1/EgtB/PvdO family nonheme iron enzyme [Defluviicoccus sp.]|nr:SUMF1/EgtB/PvdO family nonheme iron enzyme [Defluviicoccus sp.]MDG4591200.1 SUMF1/EgtB/PvdO family nonheme iron enzyme [Defluviicoccus sp.]